MKRTTLLANNALEQWEAERDRLYGPLPLNIFKALREQASLSHEALARQMHTTKHTLIRLEQGTFTNPLPVAVNYWSKYHGISELTLQDSYEEFQELTRQHYFKLFGPDLLNDVFDYTSAHPLKNLRGATESHPAFSVMQISKMLCIPQATLTFWENRWRSQKSVPKQVALALTAVGYPVEHVNSFCIYYENWRKDNVEALRVS